MSANEFLEDDLLLEIGRVAALRGALRQRLLSTGDALLSTRLGDQGIVRLTMHQREIPEICSALQTLGMVRGVAPEAMHVLDDVVKNYGADVETAQRIATGSWTYLGGDKPRHYGLFLGEAAQDGDLMPQWQEMTVANMRQLVCRLEQAYEKLRVLRAYFSVAAQSENKKED